MGLKIIQSFVASFMDDPKQMKLIHFSLRFVIKLAFVSISSNLLDQWFSTLNTPTPGGTLEISRGT